MHERKDIKKEKRRPKTMGFVVLMAVAAILVIGTYLVKLPEEEEYNRNGEIQLEQ